MHFLALFDALFQNFAFQNALFSTFVGLGTHFFSKKCVLTPFSKNQEIRPSVREKKNPEIFYFVEHFFGFKNCFSLVSEEMGGQN